MIYVTVILSAFVLAALAYRYDMYDREPWFMLALAIGLGMFACWGIGHFEDWVIVEVGEVGMSVWVRSALASTSEECCKLSVVVVIATCFYWYFNDPLDGLIYGAFAGLGFALFESGMYINLAKHSLPQPTSMELYGQEAIRLMLHFLTGGLGAVGLGLIKYKVSQAKFIMFSWFGAALAIHFLWDCACGLPAQSGDPSGMFQRSTAIGLMLFATGLFGVAVYVGAAWSRAIHPPDDPTQRLFGWPFSLLVRRQK